MLKNLIFFAAMFLVIFSSVASAKSILYIPIDNRPCNLKQVAEVAEKLGYEVVTPPEELLGTGATPDKFGKPEELWQWLNDNAADSTAAVISTDAMLYGSLVGSRQHNLTAEEILNRAEKFSDFKKNFPYLPIYAFGTIMRTPTAAGSSAEPEYYRQYGAAFFEYTALKDKQETEKLSRKEQKQLAWLDYYIPNEYKEDWFARRNKNFNANKYFIDMVKFGMFEYFLIGCDDNTIFSQTHLESRHLKQYAAGYEKSQFQVTAGADELGMLMVSRAINKDLNEIPFVTAFYNEGKGGNTIPNYSNEKISNSVYDAIFAAGGLPVPAPERADLVLAVNTNFDGKTFDAGSEKNSLKPRKSTKNFMQILDNLTEKNYPVAVADISFANGSDNALMEQIKNKDLQFKIQAYGGWNTATNSSGFVIGAGVLTKFMTEHEKNSLLLTRYFDDWIYQANVRTILRRDVNKIPGNGNGMDLDEKFEGAKLQTTDLVKDFAQKNFKLPQGTFLKNISADFTWRRLFEADISFDFEQ